MQFVLNKILNAALVLLGVVILVFIMFQQLGDPAKLLMGQSGNKATLDNIRAELKLDEPAWKQLAYYVNDVSPISLHHANAIKRKNLKGLFIGADLKFGIKIPYLGKSYQTKKETLSVLWEALPGTIVLTLTAMIFAVVMGILLGVLAAVKKNTWIDHASIISSIAGISVPSFFAAILMLYFFAIVLGPYTGLHISGSLFELNPATGERELVLKNLILPAITLGIRPLAIITQLTRSTMLDVLNQDFIRTGYAKGLTRKQVVFRHALPNALNPVITAVTGWFAELLAGAFFIEFIFGWKGLGKVTVDALEKLDYPIVMGSVLFAATIFVLVNILSDILYRMFDPRIR